MDNNFKLILSGTNVAPFTKSLDFNLVSKIEKVFNIQSSDGYQNIDLTDIINYRFIIITSEAIHFTVKFTISAVDTEISCKDLFIFSPKDDAFMATISALQIKSEIAGYNKFNVYVIGL